MTVPLPKPDIRAQKPTREQFWTLPRTPIVLVLDRMKCAHNVGTLLRLADALLLEGVYICGTKLLPPNYKVKRAARGSERWVPWYAATSAFCVVQELRNRGMAIVSGEITAESELYTEVRCESSVCLVLGNEYDGIDPKVLAISDQILHIPIWGMTNSLNVATAGAILLYETVQKMGWGGESEPRKRMIGTN